MPKRFFGRNQDRVDFLINCLTGLKASEAQAIAGQMNAGTAQRVAARRTAQSLARAQGRSADWSAGRAYGSSAVDAAAYNAERVHYAEISRGRSHWSATREACRDAAAVATISDILDPATAEILAGPVALACPSLRPLILGR